MDQENPHFLTSLPGILTGLAALVTAAAGGYGLLKNSRQAAPPANAVAPPANAVAPPANAVAPPANAVAPPANAAASPAAPALAASRQASTDGEEAPFSRTAVVNDPDGYVNVRDGKSTKSRIIAEVHRPAKLRTHSQKGDWWVVRMEDGAQGYVYATRIRLVEG